MGGKPRHAPYNGWATQMAKRMQRRFDEIEAGYNFDYGPEFEVAMGSVLAQLLPGRAGVCRGFIVTSGGDTVGDDIIVYDRNRYPTVRATTGSVAIKERVPAEGVLAYFEAKHCLDEKTLPTALVQVSRVKDLSRPPVRMGASSGAGWPSIRNPWYTAVFARTMKPAAGKDPTEWLLAELRSAEERELNLPDLIVAGALLVVPAWRTGQTVQLRPFRCDGAASMVTPGGSDAFGMGVVHLLWAMDHIVLGPLPWETLFRAATLDNWPA